MSFANIRSLAALDLRALVRDRRTVIFSIVLPLVVMPLFLFISTTIEKRRQERLEERTYSYAVAGEEAEAAREVVETALARPPATESGEQMARFKLSPSGDPLADLREGELDVYVEQVRGERAREMAALDAEVAAGSAPLDAPAIVLHFRSDSSVSSAAASRLQRALAKDRRERREQLLADRGLFVADTPLARVAMRDVASSSQTAGSRIARFLTVLVVFLMLMGGATVASDVIAGERERGTLETLLTTAASREEIVAAKLLVVFAVAVVIITVELAGILAYASLRIIDLPADYGAILTPANLAVLLLLYLPVGALVSTVLLLLSGYARGYKEAQLYFFPVVLLGAVIGAAPVLPGIDLRSAIAVVPIAGISVAVKEILVGEYDWPMIALAWFSTIGAAVAVAWRAAVLLKSEDFITGAAEDAAEAAGGRGRYRRHVLRWFAMMWVAVFALSSYQSQLDLRIQVAINVVGIFLGASLLMMWVYKLDPREVLRLNAIRPMGWLAVIVGAPSALVVGLGVAQIAGYFLPVPRELLEQFGRQLFPEGVTIWQMLLFIAVLPGVCEEIAFRGMLLSGLQRRFKPVTLAIVVGVIFGLFHFTLFRLASTAFLGMLLAAVTLMTGSIFPAIVWHVLNNAVATLAAYSGYEGDVPIWWSAVAVVPLAASLWVLKRSRVERPSTTDGRRDDRA